MMPAFLHFYPGYTDSTYRRVPHGTWVELVTYMNKSAKAA